MTRVALHHEGQVIALPAGDSLIGRALECRIRFNDPAVSRHHVRIVVRDDGAVVQNLSRTNATLLNGAPIAAPTPLKDGDVLRVGHMRLRAEIHAEPRGARADGDEPGDDGDLGRADEITQPGAQPGGGTVSLVAALADRLPPSSRTTSRTQEIKVEQVATRAHPRFAYEVAVVYSSEALVIDALVRDLSRGGVFVATDLLDPVGTPCEVTALPDGHAAVRLTGKVVHVVHEANDRARPPGLGIQFTELDATAAAWLDQVVRRLEDAAAAAADGGETVDVDL